MTEAAPTLATKERRVTLGVFGNFMRLRTLSIARDATARGIAVVAGHARVRKSAACTPMTNIVRFRDRWGEHEHGHFSAGRALSATKRGTACARPTRC